MDIDIGRLWYILHHSIWWINFRCKWWLQL